MDFFEEKEKEKKDKELFKSTFERNLRIVKLVLPIVFSGVGCLLIIVGLILFFSVDKFPGILLMSLGGFYILLGILILLILSKINPDKVYERYQGRVKAGKPIYNTNEMSFRIIALEKRVKELEEEIESLRKNR